MKNTVWFTVLDAVSPKSSERRREQLTKAYEGLVMKNGMLCVKNSKKN